MKTKKILTSISYKNFNSQLEEFIVPSFNNELSLIGVTSGNISEYGMVVFVGKEIGPNDIFSKLVESGQQINDIAKAFDMINKYIEELQEFKIGNVISIKPNGKDCFKLFKEANNYLPNDRRLP